MMSRATHDIWKILINDHDFWAQTYMIFRVEIQKYGYILVFFGPSEKSKFESRTVLLLSQTLYCIRLIS